MALFSKKPRPVATPPSAAPAASATIEPPPSVFRPGAPDEAKVQQFGAQLLELAKGHKTGLLSAKFYSDWLMEWSMKDPNFKVQMFRYVDAFPMLRTTDDKFDLLKDYLGQPGVTVPGPIELGIKAGGLARGLFVGTVSKQIEGMAGKFIAGVDAASALPRLKDLWNDGMAFSVDLLGEACVSDEEADAYQRKYLDLINNLPATVASWKPNPRLESDHLGAIPRTNVSIKISSLSARCDPIDTDGSIKELMRRIVPILEAAKKNKVFVNFDMEQFALKDLTIELFQRCCEAVDFDAGLAMQAYLRSGEDDARRVCDWARRTGRIVTVRLVKGAYWDYQVIHAEQMGWPCPVWPTKRQTDACFERMTDIFLDAAPVRSDTGSRPAGVKLALGSHNARSIAYALAGLQKRSLPSNALELQMLHGMADQLKYAASADAPAGLGLRLREYVPVGEMIPGMAYLVRRLLENTSNESWLKAGFLDNADLSRLLASPHRPTDVESAGRNPTRGISLEGGGRSTGTDPLKHTLSPAVAGVGDGKPFFNEPMRDFSQAVVREAFAAAVGRAQVPQVANDTTPQAAGEMVAKADRAFASWRDTDPLTRAAVLTKAAAIMRDRRDELSAVMIKEAGKTWREADADTCEAIDFCEYYARLAVGLFSRERMGKFIGELDEQWYQPRGVAVVISPWNFPLAICCGMTVAALVTGNTVICKPAEQTPAIARLLCDILWQAGAPREVLHFCPAPGETTGAALVRDPRVAVIAFTGSRDVGLDILNAAAPPSPFVQPRSTAIKDLTHVRRIVCEMGGKNALIVDASADLDEAVLAIRHSAFGFQGQKCSACSRLIVVDSEGESGPAIRNVIRRLVEASRALVIGDPSRSGTDIGPVIDADAAAKIRSFIQIAKSEGCRLELEMPLPSDNSFIASAPERFIAPVIFSGVRPEHTIAREEIFGPVLAIMHAPDFQTALDMANASAYKLTGGVFTRRPSHIEQAKREFRVGNLYINRGITGALVARQPFGGFGMSGVGSKAGGRDYLLQFVEPRASCENTMRRGFAPEL